MDALEAPGNMLDLPALLLADLLALDAAARTGPFLRAQLVDMRGDREILEVGQVAAAFAPLHAPQFFVRLGMRRNIVRVDRLLVQCLGEAEQHLRQIALGLKTIRARTVIPLLVASQFHLQTQVLDVQIVGAVVSRRAHVHRAPAAASPRTIAFRASLSSGNSTNLSVGGTYK